MTHTDTGVKQRLFFWGKRLYLVSVVIALVSAVAGSLNSTAMWGAVLTSWTPWFLGFCWFSVPVCLGFAWSRVVNTYLGIGLSPKQWLPMQAAAWGGRYLPGKVGLVLGKIGLLRPYAISWRATSFTVLYEQLAYVVSGGLIVFVLAHTLQGSWFKSIPLFLLYLSAWTRASIAVAVLLAFVLVMDRLARRFVRSPKPTHALVRAGTTVPVYLVAHVVVGAGLDVFLDSIGVPLGLVPAIALFALANTVGVLAVFAPAGLGVREVVLVAGLAHHLPASDALALVGFIRLLTSAADLAFFALGGGLLAFCKNSAASPPRRGR